MLRSTMMMASNSSGLWAVKAEWRAADFAVREGPLGILVSVPAEACWPKKSANRSAVR